MEVYSDQITILKKTDEIIYSEKEIADFELAGKIEESDKKGNVKTEVFEEINNSEPLQIIGEKRENQESSNLENKKTKEEFVVPTRYIHPPMVRTQEEQYREQNQVRNFRRNLKHTVEKFATGTSDPLFEITVTYNYKGGNFSCCNSVFFQRNEFVIVFS
jgi:hypothetical protein